MTRNPFAVKNGRTIFIDDLTESERGLNCECTCPVCEGEFIAKMGDERIHHFSHSKDSCDEAIAYTTGLYMMLKQMFDEGCQFYIPALVVGYNIYPYRYLSLETIEQFVKIVPETDDTETNIVVKKGACIKFDNAEFSYDNKNCIQALELSYKGRHMAIKVTPPDTVCKTGAVSKHGNLPTLEMDFRKDDKLIQNSSSKSFREYVEKSKNLSRWIYNEKTKEVYPKIIKINNEKYEEYLGKKKEQEVIRRQWLEEEQKRRKEQQTLFEQKSEMMPSHNYIPEITKEEQNRKGYEQVKDLFTQQDTIIRDEFGTRWIKCKLCGEIKINSDFVSYGGRNDKNLGKCSKCFRKDR